MNQLNNDSKTNFATRHHQRIEKYNEPVVPIQSNEPYFLLFEKLPDGSFTKDSSLESNITKVNQAVKKSRHRASVDVFEFKVAFKEKKKGIIIELFHFLCDNNFINHKAIEVDFQQLFSGRDLTKKHLSVCWEGSIKSLIFLYQKLSVYIIKKTNYAEILSNGILVNKKNESLKSSSLKSTMVKMRKQGIFDTKIKSKQSKEKCNTEEFKSIENLIKQLGQL